MSRARPSSRISCVLTARLWLDAPIMSGDSGRWRALGLLSLAELLALSLWFSASAVLPALSREWALGDAGRAGLTIAVQAGFRDASETTPASGPIPSGSPSSGRA